MLYMYYFFVVIVFFIFYFFLYDFCGQDPSHTNCRAERAVILEVQMMRITVRGYHSGRDHHHHHYLAPSELWERESNAPFNAI